MKALKFCVADGALFWKNHEGILLNCLTMNETDNVMKDFHAGDCGGHLYWKSTVDKILRVGYYWPALFADVKKFVISCHKCQIFEGKRKLLPLPLKPISTEKHFQQWGLDFIGEIHPSSSGQHKWILIALIILPSGLKPSHVGRRMTPSSFSSLKPTFCSDLAALKRSL